MFEKKQPLSSVYDKYVTPCDCQCPIIKTNKTTNQTDDNGKPNGCLVNNFNIFIKSY